MRQPQAAKSASDNPGPSNRNSPLAARNPTGAPSCGAAPKRASQPLGAFSTASSAAPPHSPPRPKPWPKRSTHSSNGAIQPAIA